MSGYIHPDYPRPATIGPWPGAVPPLVHGPGGVGTTDTAIGRGGAPGTWSQECQEQERRRTQSQGREQRHGWGRGGAGGAMTGSAAGALQENRMTGRADCPADGSTLGITALQYGHRCKLLFTISKTPCRNLDTFLQRSSSMVSFKDLCELDRLLIGRHEDMEYNFSQVKMCIDAIIGELC